MASTSMNSSWREYFEREMIEQPAGHALRIVTAVVDKDTCHSRIIMAGGEETLAGWGPMQQPYAQREEITYACRRPRGTFFGPAAPQAVPQDVISHRGFRPRKITPGAPNPMELLPEIGEGRLKSMDEAGVTVQVLSVAGPGPDLVPGPDGVALAREINDHLAAAIARHPDRFAGFANLPLAEPRRYRRSSSSAR